MRHATSQALRVVALGDFSTPIPPLLPRLAALNVAPLRYPDLAKLPAQLDSYDILLAELDWLNTLDAAQRDDLSRRAARTVGWIALTDTHSRFKDQVTWQRLGVNHFFHKPLDPERLAGLIEDIHDRLNGAPVRAILLDDDESSLSYYGELLRHAGIHVLATSDPLLVLEALDEHKPDVLILDIEMPGCRGPELATIVRQRPSYTRLPVIFLTAMESMQDKLLARAAAAEDFLAKPVQAELLLAAVEAHALRYRAFLRNEAQVLRQQAQARLRLEQLRLAIDEHAIVSIADAEGNITYANDKFCEISGYSRAELLGQNHRLVKSGLHSARFYGELWGNIKRGQVWRGEVCNKKKGGGNYWVEATIVPITDSRGRPTQFISIRTDITALKEKEAELRRSDERLRRSQTFANIGTWDWDIQTGALYWSDRIPHLFGYPTGELDTSYENFLNAVHPADRQSVIDAVNLCIEKDVPYHIEHRVVWPDGQVRWLFERGAVVRDSTGKPLHMLGVVQDIDDRKRAEIALIESQQKLQESQERLSFAVEGAGDGIWDWNMATGEMPLTGHYEEMLGYAKGELTPTVEAWKASVHPDDMPHVLRALEGYLAGTLPHYAVELRLRRKDGGWQWVLCRGTVVARDKDGRPVRMIGIHSNITERKAAEAELIATREAAERANRAKSDFLSSMSHELRTPMNAIIGFAQMLECDSALDHDQQDNVHEILKAGRHLLDLINEVLDLAKIESGRIDFSMEGVALELLVDECLPLIQPAAAKQGIVLRVELPPGATVFADRVRLKQALLNLLSNAVKYNRPAGEVRLTVQAIAAGRLRMSVSDTGPGIPAARMGELFQPFSRLGAEASEIEGTGIGLTITRRLIDMMGGEIGVDSREGAGSTFWIDLPAGKTAKVDAVDTPTTAQAAAIGKTHAVTVLGIDDNPVNLKLIAQVLGLRENIHLVTAHTPELGIEQALAHRPDLILLDINMPGMDGYQVLEVFKADAALCGIPVVAITANAMPRDIERGLAAGFAAYLTKPLAIDRFLQTIDALLTRPA